jgi:uncharacterized protein (DUF983 family)
LTAIAAYPPQSAFATGLACKCPRCGRGKLFAGYLTLAKQCAVCELDFSKADSGDGPAVFLIFILGALAVLLAYFLLYVFVLPEWISWLILVVGVIGGTLLLLRPAKAIMIALQYRHRAGEIGEGWQ